MGFLFSPNTNGMNFLDALSTHMMDKFVALSTITCIYVCDLKQVLLGFFATTCAATGNQT